MTGYTIWRARTALGRRRRPAVGQKSLGMRLVYIRAASVENSECLMRELAAYSPKHLRGSVLIELEEPSQRDLLALLSAIETCLVTNDIGSVRLQVDGDNYLFATR